ncbi:MAG: uracil-DNA glycosylase [Pseudomonadales bacterium]|jgi:uracil-DNA glycosylase|nr:uracil-DNA glycosylase [Pseudomonadales bacterium]MDP7145889.1 uracil-DNA glycosylase [Pseudomonadales bacterium]MDP7597416.1 uracil-DNA glycosylase [Pseudomonadales bacterium]HJN50108.1 uracil-DNA glycosylase [Pseudomonadales bacterium]|tara:strand:+ start:2572 stop:3279 length:708 start_codon:yes stop_codon:yes gene_type:complete
MPTPASGQINLESSWLALLQDEFQQGYMIELREFLVGEKRRRKTIYPKGSEYFNALDSTPFDQVKVVILGQDPYHGPGQAHGLCFSVQAGLDLPPSLQNIYKEIADDLKADQSAGSFLSGCLAGWAEQGVLLLNSVLTVERGRAASHQGKGWEQFTDKIVELLSTQREYLVFLLWGSYAQRKGSVIDARKHLVLSSPHPSPLSAHRGFFGNRHFSKCNDYLTSNGKEPIDWLQPG